MSRCLSRYVSWCKWRAMARLLSLMHCPIFFLRVGAFSGCSGRVARRRGPRSVGYAPLSCRVMALICQARSDREIRGVRVHCPAGILGGAASLVGVTSVTCQGGRSWSGVGVPGGEEDSTRAGDGPAWSDIVPAGAGGHPHISRQYSIVRVKAPPRNVSRSSVMNPCSRAINLKRFPDFPGSAPPWNDAHVSPSSEIRKLSP